MQLLQLVPIFFMGAAISSLFTYLGSLHSVVGSIGRGLFAVALVGLVLAFILDDAIYPMLHLSQIQYYACLIASAIAVIFGIGVIWLL